MKRLLICSLILGLSLSGAHAQSAATTKKVLLFPFKVAAPGVSEDVVADLTASLSEELVAEGDVEIISGQPFISAIQDKTVDPQRVLRVINRAGVDSAIWGTLSKVESGLILETYTLHRDKAGRARLHTTSGKDKEDLLPRIKDLAVQIGSVAANRLRVGEIKIEGNKRIGRDVILNKLDLKAGSPFRKSGISDELRDLYSLGYFEDVKIRAEDTGKGDVDLYISLKERPSIKEIEIEGNKLFTRDQILDALTTKSLKVASVEKIRNDIDKLKKMYEKDGYFQVGIDYELKEIDANQAKLIFRVTEGSKSFLTKVNFDGRKNLEESSIKKIMNVKEKSWFWFVDDTGTFTREKLDENRTRLMLFYLDNGFINVQVGAPELEIQNGAASVTYPIREGERYQVRKVDVSGDLVVPEAKLVSSLQVTPHSWFKRSLVGDDIKQITRLYNNLGYAYADVEPRQAVNDKYNFVDMKYHINKGERVTIERVDIAGNDRTRDKVIRRNVDIGEGDLYNSDRFESTKEKLDGLEFFEAVRVKTSPGSRQDLMNVTIEVMEKKTGSLSAGLGFSTQEGAMGNINLRERNLLGLGIIANAKSNISGKRNSYEGSVTYPWMFDLPLSGTIRGYKSHGKEQNYAREGEGFGITVGFPVYGLWSMSAGIARDASKLSGFDKGFAQSVVGYYRGYNSNPDKFVNFGENSMSLTLSRDTRDSSAIPSFGARVSVGSRWTGFGGDVAFTNYFSEAVYYQRLFWKAIFKFKANAALLTEFRDDPIPFDRRMMLGGISSIRGYRQSEIGPKDRFGNTLGGDRSLYQNLEVMFPIIESMKLSGVVFMDTGNAWNAMESAFPKEIKSGVGLGVRWVSPMGPVRFEYGWKIKPEVGEEPGAFAFGMGQLF